MSDKIDNVVLATGTLLWKDKGVASVEDAALALMKACRYAGNTFHFWPVGLHTFVVCDLLPDGLKLDGHLHDWAEVGGGDRPKPFKTPEMEAEEDVIEARFYAAHGIPAPSVFSRRIIKACDRAAVQGETWTVGPPGLGKLRYPDRVKYLEDLVWKYVVLFPAADCVASGGGRAAEEFIRRYWDYRKLRGL